MAEAISSGTVIIHIKREGDSLKNRVIVDKEVGVEQCGWRPTRDEPYLRIVTDATGVGLCRLINLFRFLDSYHNMLDQNYGPKWRTLRTMPAEVRAWMNLPDFAEDMLDKSPDEGAVLFQWPEWMRRGPPEDLLASHDESAMAVGMVVHWFGLYDDEQEFLAHEPEQVMFRHSSLAGARRAGMTHFNGLIFYLATWNPPSLARLEVGELVT
jgi:hypothetical protein